MPEQALAEQDAPLREWDGEIGIEWPGVPAAGHTLSGWQVAPYGPGGPVTTAVSVTLHVSPEDVIWAEATMFADEDGKPVLRVPPGGQLHMKDGEIVTGTFRFLVTSMRIAGQQEEIGRLRRMLSDPEFREQEALKQARRNPPRPIGQTRAG